MGQVRAGVTVVLAAAEGGVVTFLSWFLHPVVPGKHRSQTGGLEKDHSGSCGLVLTPTNHFITTCLYISLPGEQRTGTRP